MGENIQKNIDNGLWSKAYEDSLDLIQKWDHSSSKLSVFIDHKCINTINIELWKLSQYIESKTKDESLASIHAFKSYLQYIMDMEKVNIANIF